MFFSGTFTLILNSTCYIHMLYSRLKRSRLMCGVGVRLSQTSKISDFNSIAHACDIPGGSGARSLWVTQCFGIGGTSPLYLLWLYDPRAAMPWNETRNQTVPCLLKKVVGDPMSVNVNK